jgi:hypothetical protein
MRNLPSSVIEQLQLIEISLPNIDLQLPYFKNKPTPQFEDFRLSADLNIGTYLVIGNVALENLKAIMLPPRFSVSFVGFQGTEVAKVTNTEVIVPKEFVIQNAAGTFKTLVKEVVVSRI